MSVTVNSNELLEILKLTKPSHNIMLIGKHGIGKSQFITEYFSSMGLKVVTLFLGQMSDPGDIIGLPYKNEETGQTDFLLPYWFPTDNTPIVLFLDELNRARPEVLQTVMDLTLNRKLAGKSLPEESRVISAVNYGSEYQLTDLDPALISRFNIYKFVPSVENWLLWAAGHDVDNRIIHFIEQNPEQLDSQVTDDNFDDLENKSPDRRAWVRVSDIIKNENKLSNIHKKAIAGIVGTAAAVKFFEFSSKSDILTAENLLLCNFKDSQRMLVSYSVPQFSVLNEGIFRFLQLQKYDEKKKTLIAENLVQYFDFMEQKSMRECIANFSEYFSRNDYPDSILFILENCDSLYLRITDFIKSIR